ncbi:carboxypeptidase-like regulatory domain-containing protein [Hymenobacter monticola]|uniref:Carboxypeptidase-like regulatory domain-containing protein n=1 Tax=Hymenobacter monticola TaxID=1705399 RepID=A0ABY4BA19_9BACT|nr:carboxypeptidase-like regulatory domain-containing protein [Hymenobacter monticola]UOE36021.1 carboxypeptidase-like regulatory domain-containing protein [Hymenobacter monticola]
MIVELVSCARGGWARQSPRRWLLALLCLLVAGAAHAQAPNTVRLTGTVAEATSRQPVPGATVQVQRTRRGMVTDATGSFGLDVLPTDTVLFRALGFKTQRLPMGGTGLSQLVVRIQLVRDSVQLGEVQVVSDRADRAVINRALRNIKRPAPPVVSGVKRPPKPKPLFAVDSTAPKAPVPTIQSPVSLIYDQFSREGKQRRKMEEIEAEQRAEKIRKARAQYNKAFKDNRGYEP